MSNSIWHSLQIVTNSTCSLEIQHVQNNLRQNTHKEKHVSKKTQSNTNEYTLSHKLLETRWAQISNQQLACLRQTAVRDRDI